MAKVRYVGEAVVVVRYVGEAVVVVPVGGGLAVAPGDVVDVPGDVARRLVESGRFKPVRPPRKP